MSPEKASNIITTCSPDFSINKRGSTSTITPGNTNMVELPIVDLEKGIVSCEHYKYGRCKVLKECWVQNNDSYTTVISKQTS